jgi:hypothetical protein
MVNKFKIGDSFLYTINGFQFNAYVEADGFENTPIIWLIHLSSAFGEKILEIPEQIYGILVKKIDVCSNIIHCTECIKFPKGIRFTSTMDLNCPMIEFADLHDFYNNVTYIFNHCYYTQLKINGVIIDHLVMRKNMILKTWQFKTLDFINIDDLPSIKIVGCQIEKIINTDKITILPKKFEIRNRIKAPLRFPNLTVIESESVSYGRTIITGDKLTFIEKNAVYLGFQEPVKPYIISYIITESNPIMYEQDPHGPIEIIKHEKNILP